MKKISFLLVFCLGLLGSNLGAQAVEVRYQVKAEGNDPMVAVLNEAVFDLAALGQQANLRGLMMSSLIKFDLTAHAQDRKGLMLFDAFGQKKAVKLQSQDFEKQGQQAQFKGRFEEIKGKDKKIAGYTCRRLEMRNAEAHVILFVCDALPLPALAKTLDLGANVKGLPLAAQIERNDGVKIQFKALEVKTQTSSKRFITQTPEGYQETTLQELQGKAR